MAIALPAAAAAISPFFKVALTLPFVILVTILLLVLVFCLLINCSSYENFNHRFIFSLPQAQSVYMLLLNL